MTAPAATNVWELNHRYLLGRLASIRSTLATLAKTEVEPPTDPRTPADVAAEMPVAPALDRLVEIFGLTAIEVDLLLTCAAYELQPDFGALVAAATGDPARERPSLELASRAFAGAEPSMLAPEAPLRAWGLIEMESGAALTRAALRIGERALFFLLGHDDLDAALAARVRPLSAEAELAPSHRAVAEELVAIWSSSSRDHVLPVLHLTGTNRTELEAIAATACVRLAARPLLLRAAAVPTDSDDFQRFVRGWRREAVLGHAVLVLECAERGFDDEARAAACDRLVDEEAGPLIVLSRAGQDRWTRQVWTFEVGKPERPEQRDLWRSSLPPGIDADVASDRMTPLFDLHASTIRAIGQHASDLARASGEPLAGTLMKACRRHLRPRLEPYATRLDRAVEENDLVVPRALRESLSAIVRQVEATQLVFGLDAQPIDRIGRGLLALFHGPSGTGKTMAAEVIAQRLQLDLYRVDPSSIASKYIGETEKNLRQLFDAANGAGAILLFDEADALFGKRSSVEDAHDRYANIEVSYLLQRFEGFRGLVIVTMRLPDTIDAALLRRARFVVNFPFPDPPQRARIWQRVLSTAAVPDADVEQLASLELDGARIRSVALEASLLAADEDAPLKMAHFLAAARHEQVRRGRTVGAPT